MTFRFSKAVEARLLFHNQVHLKFMKINDHFTCVTLFEELASPPVELQALFFGLVAVGFYVHTISTRKIWQ